MTTLELTGLKGHNPLGFLAACGTMSAATLIAAVKSPMLHWQRQASGWVASLTASDLDHDGLGDVLMKHANSISTLGAWSWSTKIDDRRSFRRQARTSIQERDRHALGVLSAEASDIIHRSDALESTLFDLTSGNQRFLSSICDIAQNLSVDALSEALWGPWTYSDDAHSLGWDPQSQRLHALRHKLPEKDKANRSVRAAIFLASQAVSLFPCFAINGRLRTTGFHREDGEDWFVWPIWEEPITLDGLRSLLAHPLNNDLRQRGVAVAYRCRRVRTGGSEGNYQVFSNAEEYPFTTRTRGTMP